MKLPRRRPLVSSAIVAILCWYVAGWWWGPVVTFSLALGEAEASRVLGLAEDGSLVSVERISHTADWSVLKRQFPDCGRQEIWQTTGVRKEFPDDINFRLQTGGRWLFVSKLGPQSGHDDDPIIDLRTNRVHPGHDDGMRWATPDGRLLLTDDSESGIRVEAFESHREIGRIEENWINCLSNDGRWVAAESNGMLTVWRLDDDKVEKTAMTCEAAHPPASRLGSLNDGDHQSTCQFSADSRQFLVFGDRRLNVYDLATGNQTSQNQDHSPLAVSADGARAYERNGHVFDIASGQTLVEATGWRNDISGVRVQPDGWFLSQRHPQMSWWGRGWPGSQFRIGPYTIAVSADNSLQNVGCDLVHADTGRRVLLPGWLLPSRVSPGGYREEWSLYTHPQRLALHNEESGLVRVIEMPPSDTTAARWLTTLALFALPCFWIWWPRFR